VCVSSVDLPRGYIRRESVAKMRYREPHRLFHVTLQKKFVHAPGGGEFKVDKFGVEIFN
jgi:hypothetical protein